MNSFFRYPGGKSKLKKVISKHLSIYASENGLEYREPFFGGGSIGIEFLSMYSNRHSKIWINDKDSGIAALWTSVIRYPDLLKTMVIEFIPSVEAFYQYRDILTSISENLSSEQEIAKYGFMKLAVHQISYSGLGTKSGGPLGGKKQGGKYKIDCRWSPKYICAVKWDVVEDLVDYPQYYQGIGSRDVDDDAVAYQAVIPCEFNVSGIASFSDQEIINAMFENGYDEPLIDNTEEGLQR